MIMQKTLTASAIALGMLASLGYTAVAQQTQPTQPTVQSDASRLSAADRQFMTKAAQAGMAEVRLGQLAAQRGVSTSVKQYGQHMVDEHTTANNQLMQLATQKGVTLPSDIDAEHKAFRARIGQIPGKRFDTTYINQMVQDHNKVIALFLRESQQGQDPDVRAFATKMLPTLREHLQRARQTKTR
jgi:putative membrane protein